MEGRLLVTALGREMERLPGQQRSALLLRHQQGMSYPEIATALAVPEGTAKTLVHRGVLKLRVAMERSAPEMRADDAEQSGQAEWSDD